MNERILIIDDHEDMLALLDEILCEDYKVYLAANGEVAQEILDKEMIDLIISDVMMPGIDGFELCKTIKSDMAYCHIPIVLLTSKNSMRSHIEGLENGADAYIPKPFSEVLLKTQVSTLLQNRSKIKDHFASSPFEDARVMAQSKDDEVFLKRLDEFIRKNIRNPNIEIHDLADHMHMSRPTFYRKIKVFSSLTPKELVDITRLKMAAALITQNRYSLYEIGCMVGYSSQSLFSRNFQKYFKMSAQEYMNTLPKENDCQ